MKRETLDALRSLRALTTEALAMGVIDQAQADVELAALDACEMHPFEPPEVEIKRSTDRRRLSALAAKVMHTANHGSDAAVRDLLRRLTK